MDRGRATPSDHQSFNFHQRSPQPSTHPSAIQGFHRGAPPGTHGAPLHQHSTTTSEISPGSRSIRVWAPHLIPFSRNQRKGAPGRAKRGAMAGIILPPASRCRAFGTKRQVPKAPGDARPGRAGAPGRSTSLILTPGIDRCGRAQHPNKELAVPRIPVQ